MEFNLADLFEGVADVCGDLEALVCGESRLTYAELEERSNRLAHWLADRGIRSGDRVGLQMRNCTEFVEALIGTLKIRAVPVNVNFRYVAGELRYLYEDAGLRALVLHDEFVPRAAEVAPDVAGLDVVAVVGGGPAASTPCAAPGGGWGPPPGPAGGGAAWGGGGGGPGPSTPPATRRHWRPRLRNGTSRGVPATTSGWCTRAARPACPRA